MTKQIFIVSYQHFDIIWRRSIDYYRQLREEIILMVLKMLRKYPEFKFTLSQAVVFRIFLEQHPELKEELEGYIREGRFEIIGGMETLPDVNMITGESIIRNILYGRQWLEENLGVEIKTACLEDVFGMSAQIPQILKKCGYKYIKPGRMPGTKSEVREGFCVTREDAPFIWEGLDGTRILGANPHISNHGWGIEEGLQEELEWKDEVIEQPLDVTLKEAVQVPKDKVFVVFSGEEHLPQPILVRLVKSNNHQKTVRYQFATPAEYLEEVLSDREEFEQLPVLGPEFNTEFTGCYTTRIKVKQLNRQAEHRLIEAEKIAAIVSLKGKSYPVEELKRLWRDLFLCQFHDAICGCHTDENYHFIMDRLKGVIVNSERILIDSGQYLIGDRAGSLISLPEIIVFNTLNWKRKDVIRVAGLNNGCWILSNKHIIPGQVDGQDMVFVVDVPPFGYQRYRLSKTNVGQISQVTNQFMPSGDRPKEIRTGRYTVKIDKNHLSIYDEKLKWDIVPEDKILARLIVKEDLGGLWTEEYTQREISEKITDSRVTAIVQGPVFSKVVIEGILEKKVLADKIWDDFKFVRWRREFIFYQDLDRIDLKITVDWQGKNTEVAVLFPVNIDRTKARSWYEIPFGVIERKPYPPDRYQWGRGNWPALSWVDYTDGEKGITLANTGTPGHKIEGGIISVSLLRSGTKHEWATDPEELSFDNGTHTYFFSILPHEGDFRQARSYQLGQQINSALLVFKQDLQVEEEDNLPPAESFLNIDALNIICSAFKLAEDGKGYILRLYETAGEDTQTELKITGGITDISEVDMLENAIDEGYNAGYNSKTTDDGQGNGKDKSKYRYKIANKSISLHFSPFEIKTVSLCKQLISHHNR